VSSTLIQACSPSLHTPTARGGQPLELASCCPVSTAPLPRRGGQDLVGEDFASLVDDVEERLFGTLPDDTWVYPGHGKDTTLGAERPHLAEWRARGW
jgi:hypothetical protein